LQAITGCYHTGYFRSIDTKLKNPNLMHKAHA
jgi:hypothetical protein